MSKSGQSQILLGVIVLILISLTAWVVIQGAANSKRLILAPEKMRTQDWPGAEIDSVAIWKGPSEQHWIFITGKASNLVYVCDAESGTLLHQIGSGEIDEATLSRPNGILAVEDHLYVVERDNKRIQVFSLPGLKSVGTFGEGVLEVPYGVGVRNHGSHHEVFITDNYLPVDPAGNAVPRDQRIKRFRVEISEESVSATMEVMFGPEEGSEDLEEVETILADPKSDRLLVCDEILKVVRVYNSEGVPRGEVIGDGIIEFEPEGMVFVEETPIHPGGVLVITDQGPDQTILRIFTRDGKEYLGSFSGDPNLAATDGICFIPNTFGPFERGAIYCSHVDIRIQGYSWGDVEKGFEKGD